MTNKVYVYYILQVSQTMKISSITKNHNHRFIVNLSRLLNNVGLFVLMNVLIISPIMAQETEEYNDKNRDIYLLIDQYNQAREKKDTILLENILTTDVDQLVSSGEWRRGIRSAVEGMLRSSHRNPGQRTITIEKIRRLDDNVALVDTRYEIKLQSDAVRNLWSTFVVVRQEDKWKIAAIRNMSPTAQP